MPRNDIRCMAPCDQLMNPSGGRDLGVERMRGGGVIKMVNEGMKQLPTATGWITARGKVVRPRRPLKETRGFGLCIDQNEQRCLGQFVGQDRSLMKCTSARVKRGCEGVID